MDLGAKELVFSPSQTFGAILGDVRTSDMDLTNLVPEVPAISGQADPAVLEDPELQELQNIYSRCYPIERRGGTGPSIPGLFLHWCHLNGAFFPYTISQGRETEEVKSWPDELPFPMRASFDPKNEAHIRVMTQILAHFLEKSRNYAQAADRVRAAISSA